MMNNMKFNLTRGRVLAAATMLAMSFGLHAEIQGTPGSAFDLYAKQAQISTPDGDSIEIWGFSEDTNSVAQYPGPTLIVDEGDTVVITVHNSDVPDDVSLLFPGQDQVSKTCSFASPGTLANGCNVSGIDVVASGSDTIEYTFVASKPGTYLYQSGVSPQVQTDMGLVGTLIVRPTATAVPGNAVGLAYNNTETAYDREYLFFLSEMDPKLHYLAQSGGLNQWDNADYRSVLFFMNGRNAPDTLADDFIPQMPHQPYGNLVKMYPGERILLRVVNVGRNQHPLHLHGNHYKQVARDGNLIVTTGGALSPLGDYTLNAVPGSTADLIYEWTGKDMGWDIYNAATVHTCSDLVDNRTGLAPADGFDDSSWEWCDDHGKSLPVVIPENQDLAFGGFYGGSPFLGDFGTLPIGEGGLNPSGGMVFMWHSHSERELTNNDIFPGGMLTMMIVEKRPPLAP